MPATHCTRQVEGPRAHALLQRKLASDGPCVLWEGALAAAVASFEGSRVDLTRRESTDAMANIGP